MSKIWNKPYNKYERAGGLTINNKWFGVFDHQTIAIVVEKIITREGSNQIKPMRTCNVDLLAGLNTVFVWHIRSCKFPKVSYSLTIKPDNMKDLSFDPKEGNQDEVANEGSVDTEKAADEQSQEASAGNGELVD